MIDPETPRPVLIRDLLPTRAELARNLHKYKRYGPLDPLMRRRSREPRARTKQLNLTITPDLHRRMVEASRARGMTMTTLLGAALEAYLKKGQSRDAIAWAVTFAP